MFRILYHHVEAARRTNGTCWAANRWHRAQHNHKIYINVYLHTGVQFGLSFVFALHSRNVNIFLESVFNRAEWKIWALGNTEMVEVCFSQNGKCLFRNERIESIRFSIDSYFIARCASGIAELNDKIIFLRIYRSRFFVCSLDMIIYYYYRWKRVESRRLLSSYPIFLLVYYVPTHHLSATAFLCLLMSLWSSPDMNFSHVFMCFTRTLIPVFHYFN